MTDEELEEIASDATRYIGGHPRLAFIAAFNPAQCLALLARLKAAEGALDDAQSALTALINRYGYEDDQTTPKDWSEWVSARTVRDAILSGRPT